MSIKYYILIIGILLQIIILIIYDISKTYYKTNEIHTLASIINAECGICEDTEKYMVGSVVLNRVNSNEFPNTIDSVVSQKSQFHGYRSPNYTPNKSSIEIASNLYNNIGIVPDILYFWSYKSDNRKFINSMKNRILYKEKYHYYAK